MANHIDDTLTVCFRRLINEEYSPIYNQLQDVFDYIKNSFEDDSDLQSDLVVEVMDMLEQIQFYLTTIDYEVKQ